MAHWYMVYLLKMVIFHGYVMVILNSFNLGGRSFWTMPNYDQLMSAMLNSQMIYRDVANLNKQILSRYMQLWDVPLTHPLLGYPHIPIYGNLHMYPSGHPSNSSEEVHWSRHVHKHQDIPILYQDILFICSVYTYTYNLYIPSGYLT